GPLRPAGSRRLRHAGVRPLARGAVPLLAAGGAALLGGGRKRPNILGAYCPDDHEYLDRRFTDRNQNAQSLIELFTLMMVRQPETKHFRISAPPLMILGHPAGGITYCPCAHRALLPLTFRDLMNHDPGTLRATGCPSRSIRRGPI